MMSPPAGFAAKLRWWRGHRGFSQLELAGRAEISQRHLSFLELGRSAPSRPMVLRLPVALDVSLRQQNALLLAAGFAPLWRETALTAPELAQVRSGLVYILRQQEPFPAVVVDRCWNLIQANSGAVRLVEFLLGPLAPEVSINLADALVGPDLLRPFLVNWDDVVRYFVRNVEADAAADGSAETTALLQRLLAYAGVGAVVSNSRASSRAAPSCRCTSERARSHSLCSRPLRRSARRRISRCRSCASNASSRWTRARPKSFAPGQEVRRAADQRADHADSVVPLSAAPGAPAALPAPRQAFGDQHLAE
jgi:transcriptional regulator with XRE-family HTH domain